MMTSRATLLLSIILLVPTIPISSGLNILMLNSAQIGSHYIFGNSIANVLLDRGHRIYELTTKHPAKPHPNRTSFVTEVPPPVKLHDLAELHSRSIRKSLVFLAEWSIVSCKITLDTQAARDLLTLSRDSKKRPHIDVIVHSYLTQDCIGSFASAFGNAPVVAITPFGNCLEMDELVGGPVFPGFIPHDIVIHPFDQPLGWLKRLENKWAYLVSHISRYYYQYPKTDAIAKEFFGENTLTMEEYRQRVAVVLVNSHPAIQGARPQLPAVIQVAGVHIPPVNDLPAGGLKDFLDDAKNGFMVMSFGSTVGVSNMESGKIQGLFRAFKRLHPLRVLLKWDGTWNEAEYGPLPDNVFLSPWVPQTDVLAHRNIRLFVTHCGGLSTYEVIARSVPIVGIPFHVDQNINANKLAALKVGVVLPYSELSEEIFYKAVRTVLDDKQYINSVRRLSALYHDQPETPRERAAFWIEFVARHKTAHHLRSPGELMSWVTRWMVDDIIIVAAIIIVLVLLIKRIGSEKHTMKSKTKRN